ncbi:hypothetical protein [Streptomyces decoyicus]|uniref:hypothetical protein n=1 Tax=Streptomyces decoyicus TaxID=249567 RepID=UPI00380B0788
MDEVMGGAGTVGVGVGDSDGDGDGGVEAVAEVGPGEGGRGAAVQAGHGGMVVLPVGTVRGCRCVRPAGTPAAVSGSTAGKATGTDPAGLT